MEMVMVGVSLGIEQETLFLGNKPTCENYKKSYFLAYSDFVLASCAQ